jgi:hypothetical protein
MKRSQLLLFLSLSAPSVALAYGGTTQCKDITDSSSAGYQVTFEHNEGCRDSFDISKVFVYDPSGPAEELSCLLMGGSASCGTNTADFTEDSNTGARTLVVHYKNSWTPKIHDLECDF